MMKGFAFYSLFILLAGCLEDISNVTQDLTNTQTTSQRSSAFISNSPSTLNPGQGRVLQDNPIIVSGNPSVAANQSMASFMDSAPVFITARNNLTAACNPELGGDVDLCFSVLERPTAPPLTLRSRTWGYDPDSSEFLEAHTFFHLDQTIQRFLQIYQLAYNEAFPSSGPWFNSSLSRNLFEREAFWYDSELISFSSCENIANAFFRPSTFSLCFGVDPNNIGLVFSQDPTVIYHELGHALVQIMLNQRNRAALNDPIARADMGISSYDEAGAINEGIADYMSYLMNGRSHIGEWALGRFYNLSRPLSERDPIHIQAISTNINNRLSYPRFLNYEPQNPQDIIEDIHNAGMVTSHFLVALTEDIQRSCRFDNEQSRGLVLRLLMETLGELGDLTGTASDQNFASLNPLADPEQNHVNLRQTNNNGDFVAKEWTEISNPINYRRFYQTLAKHFLSIFIKGSECSGAYTQDSFEQLLDSYGLLLFKSYNENGNGFNTGSGDRPLPAGTDDGLYGTLDDEATGHLGLNTQVDDANRLRSILLKKNRLILNPEQNATQAFVIDRQTDMQSVVSSLIASGRATNLSTLIPSDLSYNNGNGRISPGEIIGLALNVYNDSNNIMAGVQILANDWDHIKLDNDGVFRPCSINGFPSLSEGGALADHSPPRPGDCSYITRMNGGDTDPFLAGEEREFLGPVCLAFVEDTNETRWVLQDELADVVGVEDSQCLGGSSGNRHECFVRAVEGANQAHYSRINPNSTWGETFASGESTPEFRLHNVILFEVSPSTPPGTTFSCRFRTRFTNCDDCFHDPLVIGRDEDFLDFEYAGPRPFNILNFSFQVLD